HLVDEFNDLECLQRALRTFLYAPQAAQQAISELPANDRSKLEGLLWRLVQAVDACHEHVLNGVWHHDLRDGLGEDILRPNLANCTRLLQGLDHFLYKERIAFCLLYDERLELGWQLLRRQERLRHLHTVLGREGLQSEPRVIGPFSERLDVAGTIGAQTEH